MEQAYYVGTDLKFKIDITAEGFNQSEDEYEIKVVCGNQSGTGLIKLIVTAKVPDEDFDVGYRREVTVHELCYIRKP